MAAAVVAAAALGAVADPALAAQKAAKPPTTTTTSSTSTSGWTMTATTSPAGVVVRDGSGWLATFTTGARTVTLRGAPRTFSEPSTTTATVRTSTWVRLLPAPFGGQVDTAWLQSALADTSPDVLARAFAYTTGAPTVRDASGALVSADADYGPLQADGTRAEGSDFNDFLQVTWTYPDGTVDRPETDQAGALDCSGFVRMVYGYRSGVDMTLSPDGVRLPRRAVQMADSAPGVLTVPDTGVKPSSTSALAPGDLVFFDASTDDGTAIDHVGIYLGTDSAGAARFVSSRKSANGPTMGDVSGKSVLSGTGYYGSAWRAARRL